MKNLLLVFGMATSSTSFKQVKWTKEQEEKTSSRNIFNLEATSMTGREAKAIMTFYTPPKKLGFILSNRKKIFTLSLKRHFSSSRLYF